MEKVDVDKLERELVNALRADRRYSRENDAKFRAVNQRVQSYEEFRDIVKASHLAPLDRKDITDSKRNQPWNSVAYSASKKDERLTEENAPPTSIIADKVCNVQEFTREWRKLSREPKLQQYRFLLKVGGEGLHDIFKVEISMGLLGEFLLSLNEALQDNDIDEIISILDHLSRTSRFSLSIKFLSQNERQATGELFNKLSQLVDDESKLARTHTLRELAKQYDIQDIIMV